MRHVPKLLITPLSVAELSAKFTKNNPGKFNFLEPGCCLDIFPPLPPGTGTGG